MNVTGGRIEAVSGRSAYAICQSGSTSNNTTLNVSGGYIYAEAPSYAYGISGAGKINIYDGANIEVRINTRT